MVCVDPDDVAAIGYAWTASRGQRCPACGTAVPVVSAQDGTCPLCWAARCGSDPDQALGQAIAIQALDLLETDPRRVTHCIQRLRDLSEHASRPSVTAVLAHAARDLEVLAAQGDWGHPE